MFAPLARAPVAGGDVRSPRLSTLDQLPCEPPISSSVCVLLNSRLHLHGGYLRIQVKSLTSALRCYCASDRPASTKCLKCYQVGFVDYTDNDRYYSGQACRADSEPANSP